MSTLDQATRNNELEGYSIPAQRRACHAKATALGVDTVLEYADRGASARTSDRPGLQQMLAEIQDQAVDFVVVHKVDRLARNRYDDVMIALAIQKAGATLISVTENIDDTPEGQLIHGVMAAFSEFHSRNLANEARKGMAEKARRGGTVSQANTGYLNVRKKVDGHDIRTIAVDPDRGHHVTWAFERYATGDYTGARLIRELNERGFRPKRGRTVSQATLYNVLTNRYYLGFVTYRGQEYPGAHPPLVTPQTFARVQAVLASRRQAGEKHIRHHHHLKGSLICARCGHPLRFQLAKAQAYPYFYCSYRHKQHRCDQKYMPGAEVEAAIETILHRLRLTPAEQAALRSQLYQELAIEASQAQRDAAHQRRRLKQLRARRDTLTDGYLDGAITKTDLIRRQRTLEHDIQAANRLLNAAKEQKTLIAREHHRILERAANFDMAEAYRRAAPHIRRYFNHALGARYVIDDQDTSGSRFQHDVQVVRVNREPLNVERLTQALLALAD